MQNGEWIPVSKYFLDSLPRNRKFTELEAMYSMTIDYDNGRKITVSGYSRLWGWSRSKVTKFIDSMGVLVEYDEKTGKKQNQKGQIKRQIKDRKETDKGQKRFIDSKWLKKTKDRSGTDKGQIKDRSKSTTIDPIIILNPEPKKKELLSPLKNREEFLSNIPEKLYSDFPDFSKQEVENILDDLIDYCSASGKTYKNYYSALRNFLKSDRKSSPGKKAPTGNKLDFKTYQDAFSYADSHRVNGDAPKFKEDALNKVLKKHPGMFEYQRDSDFFKLTYKTYLKL